MTLEQIARVCHEANRAYCESLGDMSQPEWRNAPEWQKQSCYEGIRLQIDDPAITPEFHHKSWCDAKIRDGWKYGESKDPLKKEHPCLVPYDQLPVEQQVKDHLFAAIVAVLK